MSRATIAQSLFWKDGKTVMPLLIAVVAGIVGIHVAILLVSALTHGQHSLDGYTMVWVLMPNLVAIGAPALLVGSEEESGTLNWLRSLPVAWQKVVDAKFVVALLSVVLIWLFASAVLMIAATALSMTVRDVYSQDMLRSIGVAKLAFFSVMLLLVGFSTAYLFRSPIIALIALVPLIAIVYPSSLALVGWSMTGRFEMATFPSDVGSVRWIVAVVVALVVLLALWLVQRQLGKRRLRSPERTKRLVQSLTGSPSAYAPPKSLGLQQPSQVVALLWQQSRQIGLPAALLTIMAVIGIAVRYRFGNGMPISDVASLVIMLSALWIGGLVFYGDSVRRRCAFFADRGIAPTKIWWTRMLLPALCCLMLTLLTMGVPISGTGAPMTGALIIAGFAFGQLVSLWVTRPILTFFAAPAYMMIIAIAFAAFYAYYPDYVWTLALTAPVLLLATWHFCGRWLAGEKDLRFHGFVVAYTVVALLLPMMVVIGIRYATTPALRADWRARAMARAIADTVGTASSVTPGFDGGYSVLGNQGNITQHADLRDAAHFQQLKQSLKDELSSDVVGEYVGYSDVINVLNRFNAPAGLTSGSFADLKRDAIAVLLKWDRTIRQKVLSNQASLYYLEDAAERAEAFAVQLLTHQAESLGTDAEIAELVAMIPTEELRRESRIKGLLQEWRSYQQPRQFTGAKGHHLYKYPKIYLARQLYEDLPLLSVERRRSERFVDEATRLTWQQLEQGLPHAGTPEFSQRNALWSEADSYPYQRYTGVDQAEPLVGGNWTQTHEDAVRKLRERYPSELMKESFGTFND